jgi:hypothetical protein
VRKGSDLEKLQLALGTVFDEVGGATTEQSITCKDLRRLLYLAGKETYEISPTEMGDASTVLSLLFDLFDVSIGEVRQVVLATNDTTRADPADAVLVVDSVRPAQRPLYSIPETSLVDYMFMEETIRVVSDTLGEGDPYKPFDDRPSFARRIEIIIPWKYPFLVVSIQRLSVEQASFSDKRVVFAETLSLESGQVLVLTGVVMWSGTAFRSKATGMIESTGHYYSYIRKGLDWFRSDDLNPKKVDKVDFQALIRAKDDSNPWTHGVLLFYSE